MKIPLEQFIAATESVCKFAESLSYIPILTCVKIESTGTKLIFTASNIESQIEYFIDCAGEKFFIAIDASSLKKFSKFCIEDVSLTVKNNMAYFKSGSSKVRLGTLDGCDFPLLRKTEEIITEIDFATLHGAIEFAALFAATNDIRPEMNTVQINSAGTFIDVFGTNSKRISIESIPHIAQEFGACIPIKCAKLMDGYFKSFVVRKDQIELRGDKSIAIFKLANCKLIPARRLFDISLPHEGQISRKSLLDAVSFSAAFHDGKSRGSIKIECGETNVVRLDEKKNEADMTFDYAGSPFSLDAYSSDISDALKALTSEKIKIEFDSGNMSEAQFRLIDGPKKIIIMPLRN